jgi:hypothetical protein
MQMPENLLEFVGDVETPNLWKAVGVEAEVSAEREARTVRNVESNARP